MKENYVFFDVDDTLHRGDLFKQYMVFMAKRNFMRIMLTLPILIPGLLGYLIYPDGKRCLSIVLWCMTIFDSDGALASSDREFSAGFAATMERNLQPFAALERHLGQGDRVFLVSGSPELLLRFVYADLVDHPSITLIGSVFEKYMGGRVLGIRCILAEKVRQIRFRSGRVVQFKSGYSDSRKDSDVLALCEQKYRVTSAGLIERWPSDAL